MKIAVGQFAPTADTAENLRTMRRLAERAAAGGAQLVVFPEEAMFSERLLGEDFEELVLRGWSGFVQQLSFLAAQTGVAPGSRTARPSPALRSRGRVGPILPRAVPRAVPGAGAQSGARAGRGGTGRGYSGSSSRDPRGGHP